MNQIVIGYPRTGFTLLISVIGEILSYDDESKNETNVRLKGYCDTVGKQIQKAIEDVFAKRGLSDRLLYNGNFKQMVGGPKWIKGSNGETACFRKYIGVQGMGDFTLITSHPAEVLDYYEIVHSHVAPSLWTKINRYDEYKKFASIRNPAGTVSSACFSLNALASEYIQKFVDPVDDNDELRQDLALYKLSDMNFFESLLTPFKSYLNEFESSFVDYNVVRWEDLIMTPIRSILSISKEMGVGITEEQAKNIWQKLDHVNLTGYHKHNLRAGYGIVGGWKNWLVNEHIDAIKSFGIDKVSKNWGYDELEYLNEKNYTPFQEKISQAIKSGIVIREYLDDDLFTFAFNKSNLDLSKFDFKRYEWREHTQIERSSFADEEIVMEVWDAAERACACVNGAFRIVSQRADMEVDELTKTLLDFGCDSDLADEFVRLSTDSYRGSIEPKLLSSANGFNLVEYMGEFYVIKQSIGHVDFYADDVKSMDGIEVFGSISLAVKKIG